MTIWLNPENPGCFGDDTFWYWFKREWPSSEWYKGHAREGDIILQYSVLGAPVSPAKYVACCWEMYPEMQKRLAPQHGDWSEKVGRCLACAAGTPWRTVPTYSTAHYYESSGPPVRVIPLTVDTELFKPLGRKEELRRQHRIPSDRPVGFWSGTPHVMKGFDLLEKYAYQHPEVYWICCWSHQAGYKEDAHNTVAILQPHMNELMNCADFFLSTGRLNPLFLVEWEAMSSGLPLVNAEGVTREFPEGSSRDLIFELGWDRISAKKTWENYLLEVAES